MPSVLGDLSDPGIKLSAPACPALQVDSLPLSHQLNPLLTLDLDLNRDIPNFLSIAKQYICL